MAALVSSMLGSYYNKTGPTPAELRAEFRGQRGSVVEEVVNRAVERGELPRWAGGFAPCCVRRAWVSSMATVRH
jgi:hypothetical protein